MSKKNYYSLFQKDYIFDDVMNETGQFAVHDTVDEQTAKALGTYQGTSFSLIFPNIMTLRT